MQPQPQQLVNTAAGGNRQSGRSGIWRPSTSTWHGKIQLRGTSAEITILEIIALALFYFPLNDVNCPIFAFTRVRKPNLISQSDHLCLRCVNPKDVGGYSRTLPKARGEEPAELPQEVLDWLKRNYTRGRGGDDMDSRDGSEDEEKPVKRRKTKETKETKDKDKETRGKSKSKRKSSSDDEAGKPAASSKTLRTAKKTKDKSETSDDDDEDKPDKFPDGGYKLEMMKNKKGNQVPCLYHPSLKTMLELDPKTTWKVREDSEGISHLWDTNNKSKTRTPCSQVAMEVLAPHLLKGLGSHMFTFKFK